MSLTAQLLLVNICTFMQISKQAMTWQEFNGLEDLNMFILTVRISIPIRKTVVIYMTLNVLVSEWWMSVVQKLSVFYVQITNTTLWKWVCVYN